VTVVPVAPFATNVDHWVVDHAGLTCTVERDEAAVQLLADDRIVGTVGTDETVQLTPGTPVTVAVVAGSRSCFARD
jgi:NAD+ kinase